MASAVVPGSGPSPSSRSISDEEKRWMVTGICLHKILTPALRNVLRNEMPKWYQSLIKPPTEISKQTPRMFVKKLPPSTIQLNYDSINNNIIHKSTKSYDYAVKDPLSLSKLFMKPFMACFAGFDHTMDTSAVLSVMCEAQPFITTGAAALAKKVKSDIRNEWAHCNFSHWSQLNFQTAIQDMELLVKKAGLTPVEEQLVLDDLNVWMKNGKELCLGKPVDEDLLKIAQKEVAQLEDLYKKLNEAVAENRESVLEHLATANSSLKEEITSLKESQAKTELHVQELRASQNDLLSRYVSNSKQIETLRSEFFFRCEREDVYVFHAPDTFSWFTGRKMEIKKIEDILMDGQSKQSSARKAAICGLGGSGKTCLAVQYAHRMKNHYQGGVFWFSGRDEKQLENSVNDLALTIGTFVSNSFDVTLSQTLARISRIQKAWLLIIDDMDELRLSPNVRKLLSGSWQKNTIGHIIVTTRRKPSTLVQDVPLQEITETSCLQLQCFDGDDSKEFLFIRTGIPRNEESETAAYRLFEELGGLPLALEQAAAYIKSLGCAFSSYVEIYEAKRLALLNEQSTNPVSEYVSEERLAVRTTWLLNIEYINQSSEGKNAIRFLNACIFFDSNEIQHDLINVGEPPVVDEQFRVSVGTSLGRHQIIKLLTDFSLFKQFKSGCLQVHRLVLDVIKEGLTSAEQDESFIDAVRLLHYAFSKSLSPDQLLLSVTKRETGALDRTNPSLFYMWRTLCMHAGEIEKNLKRFLVDRCNGVGETVFSEEAARIVYQSALYLSAFCRHEDAMQAMKFAQKILGWVSQDNSEMLSAKINGVFPHVLPLPEFIRRHVQYCSKAPNLSPCNAKHDANSSTEVDTEVQKLRKEGNRLFLEGRFEEAVEVYSGVINGNDKPELFDPSFFSNRASAYLRLKLWKEALQDAKAYISHRPKCWKGYARKALALHGLDDLAGAELAAAQAYNLCRDVFSKEGPFKKFSYLQNCAKFCNSDSELLDSLQTSVVGKSLIFLSPGTYNITKDVFLMNFIIVGCANQSGLNEDQDSRIRINFKDSSKLFVFEQCGLADLSFLFNQGNTLTQPTSITVLYNCSFSSRNVKMPSLQISGVAKVEKCEFNNSAAGGLLCVGVSDIENCTFSYNGKAGLEVREGGTMTARNAYSYNNRQGVLVGPRAKQCVVVGSQLNCNVGEGIFITCCNDAEIRLSNNSIFHNDHFGISVWDSSAKIEENRIFENNWWGLWLQSNSQCHISKNEVSHNKLGGIRVGKRPSGYSPSVVQFNTISNNGGPGLIENVNDFEVNSFSFGKQIFPVDSVNPLQCNNPAIPLELQDTLVSAQCLGNNLQDNEQERIFANNLTKVRRFCSYCRKENESLQKCTKCYTAEYCGRACQKEHWKRHKIVCNSLLKQSSVLLTSAKPYLENTSTNFHHHGLQEVGPRYSKPPPEDGKRFVVKVQEGYNPFDFTSVSLVMYDRSLVVNKQFYSAHIDNIVRDLGAICAKKYVEKKLFMWASFTKEKIIRLFTNDFPPYAQW
ncbi:uncharacterized protein LOC114527776 [Dendronephthya gigantea]|uniref:uncharacterized protein LOC114527776 n=1 Tax=Dendronephthya gigantea TaxID=151771 RepID=UPI00106A3022|nr:uncharacterized protein LOC114527776 [Dendronephthya gigantea]